MNRELYLREVSVLTWSDLVVVVVVVVEGELIKENLEQRGE